MRPLNCVDCLGRFDLDVPAAVPRTPGRRSTDQVVAGGPFGPANDMIGPWTRGLGIQCVEPAA